MAGSTSQVEPTFQATWCAVVALSWVSAACNGCIAIQACTYFGKFFHRDHYILKCAVAYIWFGCAALVLCEFWVTYDIIIVGYYLPSGLVTISLGFPIAIAMGITVSCSVQGIYIFRVYRFSHNRYILVCCCVLVGIELGTGFTWVGRMARAVPAWQDAVLNQESKWIITTFFATVMSLDVFITASMCYQLWRSRMMGLKRTRYLVDKLMRWTIQTGMLTSTAALAIVLTEHLNNKNNAYLWLGMNILGPNCYAMGLLALLNARTNLNAELNTDHLSLPTISLVRTGTPGISPVAARSA